MSDEHQGLADDIAYCANLDDEQWDNVIEMLWSGEDEAE